MGHKTPAVVPGPSLLPAGRRRSGLTPSGSAKIAGNLHFRRQCWKKGIKPIGQRIDGSLKRTTYTGRNMPNPAPSGVGCGTR